MLDFEQLPLVQPAVLITIITEAVLKDSIVSLLTSLKVKDYAIGEVQGKRYHTRHQATVSDAEVETRVETHVDTNVEIRAIVSQELSNVIFYALKEHQSDFAITAYRQPIEALSD